MESQCVPFETGFFHSASALEMTQVAEGSEVCSFLLLRGVHGADAPLVQDLRFSPGFMQEQIKLLGMRTQVSCEHTFLFLG